MSSNISNFSQSFIRWAGSKRQLVPILSQYWHEDFVRYVEPFAGSACLFFSIKPRKALLGDINPELINTYKEIKSDVESVLVVLKKLNNKRSKSEYYRIRSLNPKKLSPQERAARFIYLNRYCFNGLYRTNSKGEFNVPYCGDNRGVMPPDEMFRNAAKLLKGADLVCGNFEKTLSKVKPGDFVYMDPPFSVRSEKIFNSYDKSKFNDDDIGKLRLWMQKLDKMGIKFVVSYAESPEAESLIGKFHFRSEAVRRSIAGFTSKRKKAKEIIIFN